MRVEYIHIVQPHAAEALIERCDEIFPRSPVAVRAGPHLISCFGGYEHFVAIWRERTAEHLSECFFGSAVARSVVVGQVEGSYAMVESCVHYLLAARQWREFAEIVPEAQRYAGEQDAAAACAGIFHAAVVAVRGCFIYVFNHNVSVGFSWLECVECWKTKWMNTK